mgnify:CR=1 FL=1
MHVSQQILELVEKGMTQELIADKANIYQSKVSRLCTGKTKNPRWSDVQAIHDLYQFVISENNHWDFYLLEEEEA